jgi:hypothetical protein
MTKGAGYATPNDGAMVEGMSRAMKPFIIGANFR